MVEDNMANRKTAKKRFLKECKLKAYFEQLKNLEDLEEANSKEQIKEEPIHD